MGLIHPAAAEGFARTVDDYERARPSYPPDAIAHLVDTLGIGPDRTVADVAAGTGKLTRLLVSSGARVVAVEPIAEMRAALHDAVPTAEVMEGTAEALPLASGEVDAITVAQAYHWFDPEAALAEFHRVLKPGGGLAVVYNQRDGDVPWLAAINQIVEPYRHGAPHQRHHRFVPNEQFSPIEPARFDNPQTLSPDEVVARFRSLSFIGALGPAEQSQVLSEIAHLLASHSDTAGLTELVIPHKTIVSVCRRR